MERKEEAREMHQVQGSVPHEEDHSGQLAFLSRSSLPLPVITRVRGCPGTLVMYFRATRNSMWCAMVEVLDTPTASLIWAIEGGYPTSVMCSSMKRSTCPQEVCPYGARSGTGDRTI